MMARFPLPKRGYQLIPRHLINWVRQEDVGYLGTVGMSDRHIYFAIPVRIDNGGLSGLYAGLPNSPSSVMN